MASRVDINIFKIINYIITFSQSCGIDLGDRYLVIGGLVNSVGGRKVTQYKDTGIVNGFDRILPDLTVGRYAHSCAKFQNEFGDTVGLNFAKI